MPEQDRERLTGKTIITSSSDVAISRNLEIIRGEIEGTNSQTVDVDLYDVKMIGSVTDVDNEADISPKSVTPRRKFGSGDSAYGSSIHKARQLRLKKAA